VFSSKSHAFAESGRVTYSKREGAILFISQPGIWVDTAVDYCPAVPIALLTEREWRPLALLAERTLRPFLVDILCLKPCLFLLFLFRGWKVLFIAY